MSHTTSLKEQIEPEYVPYGDQWKDAVMKMRKQDIIRLFAELGKSKSEREKQLEEALNWTLVFVRDLRYPEQHAKKEEILKLLNP